LLVSECVFPICAVTACQVAGSRHCMYKARSRASGVTIFADPVKPRRSFAYNAYGVAMAERGARPPVHPVRKMMLRAVRHLFTPLRPDDYLEMINPLWTTREMRGRVEKVVPEGKEAASVLIRPAYE